MSTRQSLPRRQARRKERGQEVPSPGRLALLAAVSFALFVLVLEIIWVYSELK